MPAAVLVIDGLALVRRPPRTALAALDVVVARTIDEALLIASRRRPDVVVVRPGRAATVVAEIIRHLRATLPGLPVLVVGAVPGALAPRAHRAAGVDCVPEDVRRSSSPRVVRRIAGVVPARGGLSGRELEVLGLIALDHTKRERRASRSPSVRSRATARRCCASSTS